MEENEAALTGTRECSVAATARRSRREGDEAAVTGTYPAHRRRPRETVIESGGYRHERKQRGHAQG